MFVLLFILWVVFNGKLTLEIALFGLVFSAVIFWFMTAFMDYSIKKEMAFYRLVPLGLKYIAVLVWEIIKANGVMLKLVTTDKYKLQPVVVRFVPELRTELAKVVLANSITLTPGTYTVGITSEELQVHCLDEDFSVEMESSVFVKQLQKMEHILASAKDDISKSGEGKGEQQ
jgi:multicomponent Na+:H+ antiporter subunit E